LTIHYSPFIRGIIFFILLHKLQKHFMEKMKDLRDLLKHEIKDLYSAEEQILVAMPAMIEKVSNSQLKQALQMHLQITEEQLNRLEQVQQLLNGNESEENEEDEDQATKKEGLFTRLLRRRTQSADETGSDGEKCLGMQGLIEEGEKVMAEEMEPSVMDAAIIACAQKIEHYEICGYGTARAYARELNLGRIAELLEETLDEEYEADDRLTDMAVGQVNEEAERAGSRRSRTTVSGNGQLTKTGSSSSRSAGRTPAKSTSKSRATATASNKRSGSASSGSSASSTNSRGGSSSGRGGATASRSNASGGRSKGAAKTSNSRSASPAPAKKTSNTRSTSKASGRGASTSNSRSASASRSAGKAPSKAAAAKGGRNSSGGGRSSSSAGKGRGNSNGRSSGR
jgi:ferritin-like metal-binding protein YciE